MIVKLLTEHHLEFLSLTGGYRGSSESTHVKMPHCWKSHALAQLLFVFEKKNYCHLKEGHYIHVLNGILAGSQVVDLGVSLGPITVTLS